MIKDKILTIRGKQVILDKDLAELYEVETKVLNQAVKRNINRFPKDFMFQLTEGEYKSIHSKLSLRSQIVTLEKKIGKHRKYLPYAFTEHGITALSGILRSKKATEVNIKIIRTFVEMRRFISQTIPIFQKFQQIDQKLIEYDNKFEKVFKALEIEKLPKKGIFFDGQIFDAYKFISDLIKSAKKEIILIDNYIDESILAFFNKRKKGVKTIIYTKNLTKQLQLDLKKYNSQYEKIEIKKFSKSHDRFLIIDDKIYHFGASLKDLGKKWFGFSRFKKEAVKMLEKLK